VQTKAQQLCDWYDICDEHDLVSNSGVCALIGEQQIAIFTVDWQERRQLYALSNGDPVGKANVMYRGIIGSVDAKPVVASPLYKEHYCLATGQCLENEDLALQVFAVELNAGKVRVAL